VYTGCYLGIIGTPGRRSPARPAGGYPCLCAQTKRTAGGTGQAGARSCCQPCATALAAAAGCCFVNAAASFTVPPGPDSLLARAVSQNHDCTLHVRQHSAADSLLKVPSQRTAVILADPTACSSRYADRPRADLRRSAYGPASEPGGQYSRSSIVCTARSRASKELLVAFGFREQRSRINC
jgi:hypothetical protein